MRNSKQALCRLRAAVHCDERGQIVFTFFPLLIGFFILGALSWDAGVWYFDHRTAQNQVDAAALAAIQELPSDDTTLAEAAVIDWLKHNGVDDDVADAIDVVHRNDSVVGPECTEPQIAPGNARMVFGRSSAVPEDEYDTVRVCLRRDSLVLFSGLAGVTDAIVSAGGTAAVELDPVPYALMAMDPTDCRSLDVSGEATVVLELDGESYTGSACGSNALEVRGNGDFTGAAHDVCGGWQESGSNANLAPDPSELCDLPDPWAHVDPPSGSGGSCTALATFNQPGQNGTAANEIGPGTYCHLQVEGNGTQVVLTGGEYIFTQGVTVGGQNTALTAPNETLIYMTCTTYPNPCNGTVPAPFDVKGGADDLLKLILTGHTGYENMAIYVDRTAGEGVCVTITGQGNVLIDGNVYSLGCTTDMGGQGDADFDINGTIVADNIIFRGQAEYNVEWNAEFAPKILSYALVE